MSKNLSNAHWTKDALCKFDKKFTSFHIDDVMYAKEICAECTVRGPCFETAVSINSSFTSAGTTKYDRLLAKWRRVTDERDSNFE